MAEYLSVCPPGGINFMSMCHLQDTGALSFVRANCYANYGVAVPHGKCRAFGDEERIVVHGVDRDLCWRRSAQGQYPSNSSGTTG
jgi:hypothetical protein